MIIVFDTCCGKMGACCCCKEKEFPEMTETTIPIESVLEDEDVTLDEIHDIVPSDSSLET